MLEEIREYIKKLIALYEGEKQRADTLEAKLSESQAEVESCQKQIDKLRRQIENSELSSGLFAQDNNKAEAKERVDKLIREIDKCISLMEK